jgi:7,8-dihydropterin-6-yl-methyl-4-(beta-D-ribofuranosyl)aminobenzene 5'-phosphate synthase
MWTGKGRAMRGIGVPLLAGAVIWAAALGGCDRKQTEGAVAAAADQPAAQPAQEPETEGEVMTMTVVYDNNAGAEGLRTGWGFGCVVETPAATVLFDTGGDSGTLLSNMGNLGIDPAAVDLVVLSHIHGDHVGGLAGFLADVSVREENAEVTVCVPPSFPQQFKEGVRAAGAQLVEATPGQELAEHVYTTGEMGAGIKEQALIVKAEPGLVVITGCAHPGVVEMVAQAKRLLGGEVELVFGGFHLAGESRERLESIARAFQDMGVRRAGPCHCSGDEARAVFAQIYGDGYEAITVGSRLTMAEPPPD